MNFEHFCKECFSLFEKGENPLWEDIESLAVLDPPLPFHLLCRRTFKAQPLAHFANFDKYSFIHLPGRDCEEDKTVKIR